jgi:hypothetical protein
VIGVSLLVPFENYISSIVGYPRLLTVVLLVIIVLVNRNGIAGLLIALSERLMRRKPQPSGDRT